MLKLHIKALKCRECSREFPPTMIHVCEYCFGPLEVCYDYDSIQLDRHSFQGRPKTLWRYRELLPIEDPSKIVDLGAGWTIMRKAKKLGEKLGLRNVYIKDDTVNPTRSFKDRPASVAVSKALEFNAKAIGCSSTGNLAAAIAAHAAKANLPCFIFVPIGLELAKIVQASIYGAHIIFVNGTYDDANRLANEVSYRFPDWAFANINLRPYYVEGSKTLAFETCEQLNWDPPDHVIVPTASGGLLYAICKGFEEFRKIGLIDDSPIRVTCAQASGCSPIADAFESNSDYIRPIEHPSTIAKSLAIGNPADGIYALKKVREYGGIASSVTDEEIVNAIKLLAKTEGIFAEPAGAVPIALLKKAVDSGLISPDERVVCYVTGDGLKSTEVMVEYIPKPITIEPTIESFEEAIIQRKIG